MMDSHNQALPRCVLLFVAVVFAFAVPVPSAAESHPSIEACIAYAEVDAAYDAVRKEAQAAFLAAIKKAKAAYIKKEAQAAWEGTQAARDAVRKEAEAARNAARKKAQAANDATRKEAELARDKAYLSVYKEDGGKQSSLESLMSQLLNRDRTICRELYGI